MIVIGGNGGGPSEGGGVVEGMVMVGTVVGGTVVEVVGGTAVVVVPPEGAVVVAGAVVVVEVVGATGFALTADEALPVPAALMAETRNRYPSEENVVSRSPGEACADGIPPMRRIRGASAATRRPMLLPARCHAFMADERSRRT
ncbi:MAG: hypothetical protein MK189_05970 [Acidimicrobiales bacterium]|nr:hypothetical protein [Acidimicrobiales bacterium]